MRVSETLARSWPTSPAEWKVDPLVSSLRSSSTTSRSPSLARWWAIEAPPTPPPMITTRARSGSSRGRGAKRLLDARPHDVVVQPVEVLAPVALEVEVELRDLPLHHGPGRLARVREQPHQLQGRALSVRWGVPVVGAQETLVGRLVEVVVDREVAEVEARIAHPRVLPVDDHHPPITLGADYVPGEQVV